MNILIIVGSLRKGSINMQLAKAIVGVGEGVNFEIADISQIPLYNGDLEATMPETVNNLKAKIRGADGIIIVTPEYNRSVPGVLKNAIDWTSRPFGDSAWAGKPVVVTGASGGAIGTAVAQAHLHGTLSYLDTHQMGQPELYLGSFNTRFDAEGNITDPKTREFIANFVQKFKDHIALFKP